MKILGKGKTLLLIGIIGGMSSCSLFKRTSKDSVKSASEQARQAESTKVDLKTANKETSVYTYWNDSVLYQYQNVKERVEQARFDKTKQEERVSLSTEQMSKKNEPGLLWAYVGVVAFVVVGWLLYRAKIK
jgi:hypothetical protein